MIDLSNIRSLSDFQRNTKQHLKQLKKSGAPEVLTVNGQAEVVVQSAVGYQKLMEAADLNESIQILRERLEAADTGRKGVSAKRVLAEVRASLGLAKQ
jgi:PHD/YefM family antitoxin component YafN of YafNO toxin-antitoxin module